MEVKKLEYLKKYLYNPIIYIILSSILFCTNIGSVYYFLSQKKECEKVEVQECPLVEEQLKEDMVEEIAIPTFKVDIKGYVKKPGVYEVQEGTIVNDLILLAGGLKSGATTDNINLSKKLNSEDVVVVLSKTELKKKETMGTNIQSNFETSSTQTKSNSSLEVPNKKVSLNTATKEELMTLSGIGEAKAESIIEYRNKNAFTDIKEILNISGIGEALYEKIKDNITI